MKTSEVNRFNKLYERHLRLLKLQGKSEKTIDAYSRSVRRIRDYFDCCPDKLTLDELEAYFGELVETHSWGTVKIDRNGLQFFWGHVIQRDWEWFKIIKPPKIKTLPDILTSAEIEQIIGKTRELRYRVLLLTTYAYSGEVGHSFRALPATHSDPCRPLFRSKATLFFTSQIAGLKSTFFSSFCSSLLSN
jgi:integrase/recombinase XerD